MTRFIRRSALAFLLCSAAPAAAQQGISPCAAKSLSVSSVSSNVQLATCAGTAVVWNIGTVEAFYNVGTASSTAATTSNYSVPGGGFVVLNIGTNGPYLAAITSSSTTTIRVTQGFTR